MASRHSVHTYTGIRAAQRYHICRPKAREDSEGPALVADLGPSGGRPHRWWTYGEHARGQEVWHSGIALVLWCALFQDRLSSLGDTLSCYSEVPWGSLDGLSRPAGWHTFCQYHMAKEAACIAS